MSALRPTYRRVRRAARRALGWDVRFPVQTTVSAERHGSEHGGWWVCPDGLCRGAVMSSLGIGTDITLALSPSATHGLTTHAFDPTPGTVAYVENQRLPSGYQWHPLGVGAHDGRAAFFPPENPAYISDTLLERATGARAIEVEVRRLSTIMRDLRHGRIDVLVEGSTGGTFTAAVTGILEAGGPA